MKELNFDILNIANNHTLDYGLNLKKDTKKNILDSNIKVIGENIDKYDVEIINIKESKIAFIGIDIFSINNFNEILTTIKITKQKSDYLILSIHWGIEFCLCPTIKQRKIAHMLIDNGVDIILGHHPHVLQGIEKYKNGIIIYSLGNFQFKLEKEDIDLNQYTDILKITIDKKNIKIEKYPVFITQDGIPTLELDRKQKKKYNEIINKCDYYIKNLNYFIILNEMSNYFIQQHLVAWKKRKQKNEKNYFFKKVKWFLHPRNVILTTIYFIKKIFRGEYGDN